MKILFILTAMIASVSAYARPAKCLLEVDGVKYIDGVCNYEADAGTNGDFSIGTDDGRWQYFAYVQDTGNTDGMTNAKEGFWNDDGGVPASHAQTSLGVLTRDFRQPACWTNQHAKVCAWSL
jgi:hypothetical protein